MDVNIIQSWQRVYGPFHKTSHSLHTNSPPSLIFLQQFLPPSNPAPQRHNSFSRKGLTMPLQHFMVCWEILNVLMVFKFYENVSSSKHILVWSWNRNKREMRCRWRTFLLPFPAFWLQGNDLFLSKFSFENPEYISVRMEFSTKRRKIYVKFPTVSFPAFCTLLFMWIIPHLTFKTGTCMNRIGE